MNTQKELWAAARWLVAAAVVLLGLWAPRAWAQAAPAAEAFTLTLRVTGPGVDTLFTLRAPGGDNLSVLPPAEATLPGSRRVLRIESASLYRRNYLAGQGLTLQFIEVGGRPGARARSKWIGQLLKRAPSEPPTAVGTADLEHYTHSGVEVRYRHSNGKVYRAAYGEGARVKVTLVATQRSAGKAPGGFGEYTAVVYGGVAGTLVSADGDRLNVMGTFRMGVFAPVE